MFGYHGILDTFALPSIIFSIIVGSCIILAMYITHADYWYLLLGPESKSKRPSFWTMNNYCHAKSLILPTTLSTISFATFCVFGAFLSPIAMHQIHMAVLYIFSNHSRMLCDMFFSAGLSLPLYFFVLENYMHGLMCLIVSRLSIRLTS